jgi:hypothetical protein
MDVTINGNYTTYGFLAIFQLAIFFLQRPNHIRKRTDVRGSLQSANAAIDFYCALMAFIATLLNWATWLIAIYVGYRFGALAGITFFVVGLLSGIILAALIPVGLFFDILGHIISVIALPFLVKALLSSVSLWLFL